MVLKDGANEKNGLYKDKGDNMIKVLNGALWQWDTGRKVEIKPLPGATITEVHFSNDNIEKALPVKPEDNIANIPNILLQECIPLNVYAVMTNGAGEQTTESAIFDINKRKKPDDYVYTETQLYTVTEIVEDALTRAKENGEFDGEQGPKGDKGDKGEQGPQGPQGEKGAPYTLTDTDKQDIVDLVLSNFTDVSGVGL